METNQEPSPAKAAFGRELFRLKFDLTSREHELQSAKVTETQLRKRIEQLISEATLLESSLAERDGRLRTLRSAQEKQIKEFGEQILNLRDAVWTESCKATSLDRQLDKVKEELTASRKELERSEEFRHRLLQDHISQRQSQENVISSLGSRLETLSRDNGRLNDEIVELVEIRELAKKAYEETLKQLEASKSQQSSEIKRKDEQIESLNKELQLAKGHLAQFTTNPTEQFKLITELYGAFVAAQDKIATFEEKEVALVDQQRRGVDAIQEFKDQLIEMRGVTKEYQEALTLAERDLERLKKTGSATVAPVDDALPALDAADVADLRRELELYKSQSMDEEKRKFFSAISRSADQFERLVSLASNEAVVWAFVADHGAESQVAELKKLKHELLIFKSRCHSLSNHNERLSDDWIEIQRTTEAEMERLKLELQAAVLEAGTLKVQVRDVDRVKQTQQEDIARSRADVAELNRQFGLEQLHLQEVIKDLDSERESAGRLRSALSKATFASETLQQERDTLLTEKKALEKDITSLRQSVVQLSEMATNVDAAYWAGEAEKAKAELDRSRAALEEVQGSITDADSFRTLTAECDGLRKGHAAMTAECEELRQTNDELRAVSMSLDGKIQELERRCELELKAHQASVDSFTDTQSELAAAKATIIKQQLLEKQLSTTITSLSQVNEEQQRHYSADSVLIGQERKNSEAWKEAFYHLVETSLTAGGDVPDCRRRRSTGAKDALLHLRTENDIMRKQCTLAKSEYSSVMGSLNSLQRTVQRLQGELRKWMEISSQAEISVDVSLWAKRLDEKKAMLATALEYAQYLRAELLHAKDEIAQNNVLTAQLRSQLDDARTLSESLEARQVELLEAQKKLREELAESNRRFDSDKQRLEIENLKSARALALKQKATELSKMKEHYVTQFNSQKAKHAEELEAKKTETAAVVGELNRTVAEREQEIQRLTANLAEAAKTLSAKETELTEKLKASEKKTLDLLRLKKLMETKLAADTEAAVKLRTDLQEAEEKIRRLEAAAAAHAPNLWAPQLPTAMLDAIASPVVPLVTRRQPTMSGSSSPNIPPPVVRSTAVVTPQSQSTSTVQRVTPVPQLRSVESLFHSALPQSQEGRQAHPVPSTSGTSSSSSALIPSLRRDTSAVGGGSDDPGSPSTSSSGGGGGNTSGVSRKRPLPSLTSTFERDKRQAKREASPTFSDVTSSTSNNTAPKITLIAPVGEASLLRARANSTSAGHHPSNAPLAHEPPVLMMEESGRRDAADSSDGNPDGNEQPNQEGNVTESSGSSGEAMNEDAMENQPFDRNVAEAIAAQEELEDDDDADRNEESVDDEEVDEGDNAARSSDDPLSPAAVIDEEVVSGGDSNDASLDSNGVVAADFAPCEDEESSSGSYDAEDVERPAQSSSGVSSQEPSTSSSRQRSTLPLPLPMDRNFLRGRSPGSSVLGSARTPGSLSARYDAGDEYGVVPSTPKFPAPRREDDTNAMPQVPSFFFGGSTDTLEDVTASQVPPTPRQPDGDFFAQRLEVASEDSSSFQGPEDDVVDPMVPSGSGMHREDSSSNIGSSESGVGSSVVFPTSQGLRHAASDASFTGEASTSSFEPAVPSPGSAGSSVEIISSAAIGSPLGLGLPPQMSVRGNTRGPGRLRGRGAVASVAGSAPESVDRRPILAPAVSPLTRTTAASARALGPRGRGGRPAGRTGGVSRPRRRSNLQ
ncbi:hypothetical protein BV898_05775 [Hypsibius exemplaris]|uniref:Nucleoprotein TPR n=1 Tax=Hypsibius exemplaris TaxID=2072580 RepID=A0A1W0WYF0_HYPEX|nr:hypothetical protein BV898_05775 [Hypsibius exemplaris]